LDSPDLQATHILLVENTNVSADNDDYIYVESITGLAEQQEDEDDDFVAVYHHEAEAEDQTYNEMQTDIHLNSNNGSENGVINTVQLTSRAISDVNDHPTTVDEDVGELFPELVTIQLWDADTLAGSNDTIDYRLHSHEAPFDKLSLWEHTEYVQKITKAHKDTRNSIHDQDHTNEDESIG